MRLREAGEADIERLVEMMERYCEFYETAPGRDALEGLARHLLAQPGEGMQLVAEDDGGGLAGFATIYWSWSTTRARRVGVMNDLYVEPEQRSSGVGRALIARCAQEAAKRGADRLTWQTAPSNHRAQRAYDGVDGLKADWLNYHLELP